MGKLIEKITDTNNLHWAWKKVRNNFQVGDIWYDEIDLAAFEANLYDNLENIKSEINFGTFHLNNIRPLPFPKGCDENGKPRVRQTFDISIRDQVVWMAVVNVIGNSLDSRMPWWSYGHRLYVPIWKNQNEKWEIGWYTHSNGQLYRKWNQSWPLFRRNISLTAKIMCRDKKNTQSNEEEFDNAEKNVYENNEYLPRYFKSEYLEKDYWGTKSAKQLFWGTIDFSKFYPKVKRSVIFDNILKYTADAKTDSQFKALLKNLLDFKIDSACWKLDELSKENGIDLEPTTFNGLPTGLFVAGFLSNVALLDVDNKITKDLKRERDVAHFRFVDDHVVLAYDFIKLQKWIENYKMYLEEANTGAKFNFKKIEPKSLSNILNPEWKNKEGNDLANEVDNAIKDCSLDPAFPAPLMTQTLAKVSAISKSDFEFLSRNEEEQLISDLEHLLLTDFPDHEFRKDSRVSFAASVLSRIVPNTKDDYSEVYESQKRIQHKIKSFQREFQRADKNFITQKLHDLIFDDISSIPDYFTKWKTEIDDKDQFATQKNEAIDEIKKEKEEEKRLISLINEQNISQKKRVYKLLNKAISENPEKVRIWSRVIDYCQKVGYCDVKETYDKIDELKIDKIHSLSAAFLRTLFMNILSDRIVRIVYSVENNQIISKKDIERTNFFLKTVFDETLLKDIFDKESMENKPYYSRTYEFYRFVLGSTIFILKETKCKISISQELIEQYKLIDWTNKPKDWIEKTQLKDINSWLYWLLWKTHSKTSSKPLDFWKKLQPYIDFSKPSYKSLIHPFPDFNYLPQNDNMFIKFILDSGFDEGWLYELFKTRKEQLTDEIKIELKEKHLVLYNNLFSENTNLWDFIHWQQIKLIQSQNEIDTFNQYFDPRLSEWTALEFIRQIIEKTRQTHEDFFMDNPDKKLHLANFIISADLLKDKSNKIYSWLDWSNKIRFEGGAVQLVDYAFQISDERLTTKALLESERQVGERAKVHALGVMLLQLISHNTNFPWVWNSTDKSLIWEGLCYKSIQDSPISSYSLLILQSCFSTKNRESFYMATELDNIKGDTSKSVPIIDDVLTLKKYILKAQEVIERYQLSMEDNAPRQLLPISLEQFSIQNNPFETPNNNER